MRGLIILFYIQSLVYVTKESTCFDFGTFIKDDNFAEKTSSVGFISEKIGISTRNKCENKCRFEDDCLSYFYNPETRICQLNSVMYRSTEGLEYSTGTVYYKKKLDSCSSTVPTIAHASPQFPATNVRIALGTELHYACDVGFILNGSVTCDADGQWLSTMSCIKITSCDFKCRSKYHDDHFWIYPPAFGGQRARIYCKGKQSYVSLDIANVADYPDLNNYTCFYDQTGTFQTPGKTSFTKIKVNTETMAVDRSDTTFAQQSLGSPARYGEAADCNNDAKVPCGPVGSFNIDLTGTGLKVDPNLTFKFDWNAWGEITWKERGTRLNLSCGGFNSGCQPDGPMYLKFDKPTEPTDDSAMNPVC